MTTRVQEEAERREREAWEARFRHVRAANIWTSVGEETPERRELCAILSAWQEAYADADAKAEAAFRRTRHRAENDDALRAQGAAAERARIVAWLRAYADDKNAAPSLLGPPDQLAVGYVEALRIADAIERGEHEEG